MTNLKFPFKAGDKVIGFSHGIPVRKTVVEKVLKNGNFRLVGSDQQYRQSGHGTGDWNQQYVELITKENHQAWERHNVWSGIIGRANHIGRRAERIKKLPIGDLKFMLRNMKEITKLITKGEN